MGEMEDQCLMKILLYKLGVDWLVDNHNQEREIEEQNNYSFFH